MKNDTSSLSVTGLGLIGKFIYHCIGMKNIAVYMIKVLNMYVSVFHVNNYLAWLFETSLADSNKKSKSNFSEDVPL